MSTPHAESFCSNNHPLRALFKVPDDGSLLRLVLLAVVRGHQTPVGRSHPGLDTHIYTTGKRIVKQRLMPVEKLFHTPGYDALLAFVISLSLFQCEPADVKTDVLAPDRTYIKYARSICRERMVSNTISLPPLGFHTAVAVRANRGNE